MASKAPVYDLLAGLTGSNTQADATSTAPYWCICVFPLGYPLSFSRKQMKSASSFPADGAKLRGGRLIITGDCTQLSVSASKRSHLKSMSAVLSKSDVNYLVEILPGDWVMCWMQNFEEGITGNNGIVERLKAGKACNEWMDGLKFVGRVESIRKTLQRSADGGLSVQYSLSATAFKELDNQIFYDPNLAEYAQAQVGTWLAKIGFHINELFNQSKNGNVQDNTHLIIPAMFEILFGKGISQGINPGGTGALQAATGSLGPADSDSPDPKEAPFAYLVPEEVGQALNKQSRSKQGGILAFADMMELVFGVQEYQNTNQQTDDYRKFIPKIDDNNDLTTGNHRYTGTPMLGAYLPLMPTFTNTPFWTCMEQFLNPVCNEMYTCLRVNEHGNVVPTLVLRQIPFTTDLFDSQGVGQSSDMLGPSSPADKQQVDVTRFLNLPRWRMSSKMLNTIDVGRSDATRINFVHVYGQNGYNAGIPIVRQLVMNPPIRDDLDIQRSGLRPYMTTVACDAVNQVGKTPSVWMQLVADRMIGSQLTLNGTAISTGIQEPICEGDNFEFQNVVYHIEALQHDCRITPDGNRSFITQIMLSNGLDGLVDSDHLVEASNAVNPDVSIYPGIKSDELTQNDPGISVDRNTTTAPEENGGLSSSKSGGNPSSTGDFFTNNDPNKNGVA